MLREFERTRQDKTGFRRVFFDEETTLYVWYARRQGDVIGFQLTYPEGDEQKALTWRRDEGYSHDGVDGWDSSRFNRTPLLIPDGAFAYDAVLAYLEEATAELEPALRELVLDRVREYRRSR